LRDRTEPDSGRAADDRTGDGPAAARMAGLGTHRNLQHARHPRRRGRRLHRRLEQRRPAVPDCMEINDIPLFIRKGYTGEQYLQSVVDQFDALYADSAKQPRVMGIPLHPMITGQPMRIKYLERALAHMKQRDKVWFATGSEIVDAYQRVTPS